jgi:flagellar hook-length control protein FliK
MADIAAVLDSASLAGLQAGKNSPKGLAQGAGPDVFIATLMSQMAADGVANGGKTPGLGEVAVNVSSGKSLPARSFKLITSQSIASQHPEDKSLCTVDPLVAGESNKAGQGILAPLGEKEEIAAEEPIPRPTSSAADVPANVFPPVIPSSPGALPAADISAISNNPMKDAGIPADDGKQIAPILSRALAIDSKIHASGPGKPGTSQEGVSANTAEDRGGDGQDLPVRAKSFPQGEMNSLKVLSGNESSAPVPVGATISHASPEASAMRPFEQVLRQVEPRLNVSVEAHVKTPAFANELGEKMVWLAGRQGQVAEMTLNPPQLGSVEIRLTVAGGEAGAQFFSANPTVREAIEAAMPRLRDMMAQAGINLGEANVRDQSFSQDRGTERPATTASSLLPVAEVAHEGMGFGASRSVGLGLVDLYA